MSGRTLKSVRSDRPADPLNIRAYAVCDQEAMIEIAQAHFDLLPPEILERASGNRTTVIRIAEYNGEVVGFYIGARSQEVGEDRLFHITSFMLKPECAEKSTILHRMIDDAKEIASAQKARSLCIDVSAEEQDMLDCLNKAGFESVNGEKEKRRFFIPITPYRGGSAQDQATQL